jgi:hypothetical protein
MPNEKTYWDEWAEECKDIAIVFDGTDYWAAKRREPDGVFETKFKLTEVQRLSADSFPLGGKWFSNNYLQELKNVL